MVGFLFYSELGQRCLLSTPLLNLGSVVGLLFYCELGQHGRLSILDLGNMVGFVF